MKNVLLILFAAVPVLSCGDTAKTCNDVATGRFHGSGSCFGPATADERNGDVAFDKAECKVTFSNWDVPSGYSQDLPSSADVDGDKLTMHGTNWDDCSGTLSNEGKTMTGTCSSDNCNFTIQKQ